MTHNRPRSSNVNANGWCTSGSPANRETSNPAGTFKAANDSNGVGGVSLESCVLIACRGTPLASGVSAITLPVATSPRSTLATSNRPRRRPRVLLYLKTLTPRSNYTNYQIILVIKTCVLKRPLDPRGAMVLVQGPKLPTVLQIGISYESQLQT